MNKSRVTYAKRNISIGVASQVLTVLLSFVCRTIFVNSLGANYLGLGGLFTNIINVFNMADLGFSTAVIYSMYKPLAENDEEELIALMTFYKKVYRFIAIVILIIGLSLIPFLDNIINLETDIPFVTFYYLLYLSNVVASYLCVYKSSILRANQEAYILNIATTIINIFRYAAQIVSLILFKNYTIYLVCQTVGTLLVNIIGAQLAENRYPFIKKTGILSGNKKREIGDNVKSLLFYKVGTVLLTNIDNILISTIVGTIWVGFYSNYVLIENSIKGFVTIIFNALTASVGNLVAKENREKQVRVFYTMNFLAWWCYTFCTIAFLVLYQPFIQLWIGEHYLLPFSTVITICMGFYVQGSVKIVGVFRETTGIFRQTKYVFFLASILNLIFSIILGNRLGLMGILLATIIARLLTHVWYEPFCLFRFFGKSFRSYVLKQIFYHIMFAICAFVTYRISVTVEFYNDFIDFIIKGLICVIIPNVMIAICFAWSVEFKDSIKMLTKGKLATIFKSRKEKK